MAYSAETVPERYKPLVGSRLISEKQFKRTVGYKCLGWFRKGESRFHQMRFVKLSKKVIDFCKSLD